MKKLRNLVIGISALAAASVLSVNFASAHTLNSPYQPPNRSPYAFSHDSGRAAWYFVGYNPSGGVTNTTRSNWGKGSLWIQAWNACWNGSAWSFIASFPQFVSGSGQFVVAPLCPIGSTYFYGAESVSE
jgi:hypothetical protein